MRRKIKVKTDFCANPHNIQIGDWVVHEGQRTRDKGQRKVTGEFVQEQKLIGEVIDRVDTSGDMLQFWVVWFDSISKVPIPELAINLIKVPKSEDGYVGKSIAQGLISSIIWQDEQVKYEVVKDSGLPIILTQSQIESAIGQSSLNVLNFARNTINLDQVIIDHNLQQRVKLDHDVIDDYADIYRCAEGSAYSEGVELPPITIWNCTEDNKPYLVDGFHRVEAAKQAGITELPFIEKSGTYREALLFSLGVNATHGLRRSNEDKRKAVFTLLNDEEWSQWSDREIARRCGVSNRFVSNLRQQFIHTNQDTSCDNGSLTVNVHSSTSPKDKRKYQKDGIEYEMDITNLSSNPSANSDFPQDDVFPEDVIKNLDEDNEDNLELTENEDKPENPTKPTKGKQKITNPLSIGAQRSCTVGDRVRIKDNHYFGGREGVVTQISSPSSLVVAFDNDQRELIRLQDLDLPSLSQPQKPQKKEILIKEGLNYKAGEGCKWYVEVEEEDYRLFQEYQRQVNAPSIRSCLVRAVDGQKQEKSPIKTDDLLINLSSKISYLNQEQRLLLAKQLIESDPDIFNKIIKEK